MDKIDKNIIAEIDAEIELLKKEIISTKERFSRC